jgi:hypothetical protein
VKLSNCLPLNVSLVIHLVNFFRRKSTVRRLITPYTLHLDTHRHWSSTSSHAAPELIFFFLCFIESLSLWMPFNVDTSNLMRSIFLMLFSYKRNLNILYKFRAQYSGPSVLSVTSKLKFKYQTQLSSFNSEFHRNLFLGR